MKRALLIGVDYFNNPSIKLNGCIYDVINMSHMLIDAYNYDSITVLRDDEPNAMPTRANIIKALTNLVNQSTSLDEIWFHYSGHGYLVPDKTANSYTGLDCVLVPCDYKTAGTITDKDMLAIIKNIKCRALLLFDACHSGTMCDLPWSFQYNNNNSWQKIKNNNVVIDNPNIYMISGCTDEQTSSDIFDYSDATNQGAFTNSFMKGLRYYRHNVSIVQLYQYICNNLKSNGFTQIPVLSTTVQIPNYSFLRAPISIAQSQPTVNSKAVIVKTMKSVLMS